MTPILNGRPFACSTRAGGDGLAYGLGRASGGERTETDHIAVVDKRGGLVGGKFCKGVTHLTANMQTTRQILQPHLGKDCAFLAAPRVKVRLLTSGLPSSEWTIDFPLILQIMKKLLTILGVLAGLALVGGLVLIFTLGPIITKGVNTFGPKITGTKVTLDSVSISPFTDSFTMKGLFVGNPEGWKSDKAFYMGAVHVSVAPLSVLGDHIVVKDVLIDGPEFVYETKIISSNIKDLLNNIEKATGGADAKPGDRADMPATKSGKPLKFEVKKFRLQNARVTLGVGPTAITLPMPPLTLTDLGTKEGGITPDQLVTKVMTNVLGNIVSAVTNSVGKIGSAAGATATDAASGAVKGLKSLFGGNK